MVRAFRRISHYYQKLRTIGISRCARALHYRVQKASFVKKMRKRTGGIEKVPQAMQVSCRSLSFLDELKKKCDRDRLIKSADRYVAGRFDLLGSGEQLFKKMPWHEDIRLSSQDPRAQSLFDPNQFYADISIQEGNGFTIAKDIKLPWELSRFHHLPVLGLADAVTGDEKYAESAKKQIADWLNENPYLLGVNWVCPMEVAIRATNWIVAWHWLQEAWQEDQPFCNRFISSLRDHMTYLESNWEFYDGRTSNHYLSNLVGYFYLCWFFDDERKRDWCYRELLCEFEWQIFDEGSSYEGSTRYHQLVTELTVHVVLLAREMGVEVDDKLLCKVDRMLEFLDWCTPNADGQVVAIGDDDSGSFLHKELFGLPTVASILFSKRGTFFGVKRYTQFGLSISKADDWHVTLRHHAYDRRQPSGHFHDDAGSVTIAYHGVPIIIDPGSYLYTASCDWRNQFRSVAMHNTCYLPGHEREHKELFGLDMAEARDEHLCKQGGVLRARYQIAADVSLEREVAIDEEVCVITDRVSASDMPIMKNFIFSPEISVQQEGDSWLLIHQQKPILHFTVPLHAKVVLQDTWTAPGYGRKIRTTCLQVSHIDGESVIFRVAD